MNRLIANLFVFLFSPVIALLMAVSKIREPGSRVVIWLFCSFYGMAFYADMDLGIDGVNYIRKLQEMYSSSITFESLSRLFYQGDEAHYDIWAPILTFFVSRLTDDYRVFMGAVGFVYGYFFSKTLYFFIDRLNLQTSWVEWYFVAVIAFSLDVGTGINGVRMYVAMFVFLSGVTRYFETGEIKFLAWASSSILFHFSFALPIAILLSEKLARKVHILVYLFFMLSFIISEIEVGVIRSFIEQVPGFAVRVGGYVSDGYVEARELTWLLSANRRLMKVFMMLTMSYFYFNNVAHNPNQYSSFCIFAMALYGVVNLGGQVGSILRFYVLADIVAIGYLLMQYNWHRRERQGVATLAGFSVPLLFLQLALGIRFFLGFASISLIAGNPFAIWFIDGGVSLYEYIPRFW